MGERISALQQLVSPYGKVLTIPSEISFSSDIHDQAPLSFSADRHSISTSRGDAIHSVSSRTSQGLLCFLHCFVTEQAAFVHLLILQ